MEREKVEQRRIFSKQEKEFILSKSNGKCCHCGQTVKIGKNFTVEHVIPISKGGTNDLSNLVALCEECNKKKDNYIVFPTSYLKYLDNKYKEELYYNQFDYYADVNWFTLRNFMTDDIMYIPVGVEIPTYRSRRVSVKSKYGKGAYGEHNRIVNYEANRAIYSDLDEVYEYTRRYNKKYGIDSNRDSVKKSISLLFEKGAIYVLRNNSKEIIGLVPMVVGSLGIPQPDGAEDELRAIIRILNPMFLYNKEVYYNLAQEFIKLVLENLITIGNDLGLKFMVLGLESIKEDTLSHDIFKSRRGYNCLMEDYNDGFVRGLITIKKDSETSSLGEGVTILDLIEETSNALLNKLNITVEDVMFPE